MTKDELLARMEEARAEWDRLLVEVGQDRLGEPLDPDDPDGWTPRDLIVHVMANERALIGSILASVEGTASSGAVLSDAGSPAPGATPHADDALPLGGLLRAAEEVFDDLLALMQDVPDSQLTDPAAFTWTAGVALVNLVAQQTIGHYQEHEPALRRFILAGEGLEDDPDDPVEL